MVDLSKMDKKALGKVFDYSVLPKNSTEDDIRRGCRDAIKYNCAAFYAATNYWLPVMKEELAGSDVLLGVGLDFPFGGSTADMKRRQAEEAVEMGATVLDTVMNIGALRSKRYKDVEAELAAFVKGANGVLTKCIMEVNFLTNEEIATACKMILDAGIGYAKTSSGQFDGPSMDQFLIMVDTLQGTPCKLKVAGVKFPRPQNAYAFILAGADLIGTRAAPEIIDALDNMRRIGLVPAYQG